VTREKILVVDDDAIIRNALFEFLSSRGYQVILAENGREGLDKYKESTPDLVILDLIMPEMNGVECLEEMRKVNSNTNVIVLTGFGSDEQLARLKELGVTHILKKGMGFEDFLAQVEGVLGRGDKDSSNDNHNRSDIKVLVVDDDAVIRTLLVEFLVGKGFQVMNAKDGEEALRIIKSDRPHLVFLDIIMPKMTGDELLDVLDDEVRDSIKWVLITGYSHKMKGNTRLSAHRVLKKPFSLDTFEETVNQILSEFSLPI
jgi:CheY-like chemotaxis protein